MRWVLTIAAIGSITSSGCLEHDAVGGRGAISDAVMSEALAEDLRCSEGERCGAERVCAGGQCRFGCYVDGAFIAHDDIDPRDGCRRCDAFVSVFQTVLREPGSACGPDGVCAGGMCQRGCFIDGVILADGAARLGRPCEVCAPETSRNAWSPAPVGLPCDEHAYCDAEATCVTGCLVEGVVVADGITASDNPCLSCDVALSDDSYSLVGSGVVCGAASVCVDGVCLAGCWEGAYYGLGQTNASACAKCVASQPRSLRMEPLGTPCAGGVCIDGLCAEACVIDGVPHGRFEAHPTNPCRWCDPAVDARAWTPVTDGAPCTHGWACDDGVCVDGCVIDGAHHASDETAPGNVCLVCRPDFSRVQWDVVLAGTSCGDDGAICAAGICQIACYIDERLLLAGAIAPGDWCRRCTPASSTATWTPSPDGTACPGGVCVDAACVSP